jgi:hypothetical protein
MGGGGSKKPLPHPAVTSSTGKYPSRHGLETNRVSFLLRSIRSGGEKYPSPSNVNHDHGRVELTSPRLPQVAVPGWPGSFQANGLPPCGDHFENRMDRVYGWLYDPERPMGPILL